jgi:AcrR family transcriptional regulator
VSGKLTTEPTRRRLTERQADTVRRLTEAAVAELRETGYEGLTVRNVAKRAGVAPATAYTYFGSKNHLITEIYWRRLNALPELRPSTEPPRLRVVAVLREIALLMSDEPALAAACTMAMLGIDPDVQELRLRIGLAIRGRLAVALGGAPDRKVLSALEVAYIGALVQAGMGYSSYAEIADRLADVAELIVR